MKYLMTLLTLLSSVAISAQETVSISQATDYTSDVYVSMANGEVQTQDATTWDLAFQVNSFFAVGIRINDGRDAQLYTYPHGDVDGWNDVDTTGMTEWASLNNGLQIWEEGAFNVSPNGTDEDYSWGVYTGPPNHLVVGDSLYVVQTTAGDFKKFRVDELDAGTWNFTFANIDGSDEVSTSVVSGDYPERNFVYYSLSNAEAMDMEPVVTDWDLVFTKYFGMTDFGPGQTAGVLANEGVNLIEADGVDVETADWADYTFVQEDISVVGNDWKFLNDQFEWEVVADRCYFVQNLEGSVYKLIFTSFEGASTGNIEYNTELISSSDLNDAGVEILGLYPNPASDVINIAQAGATGKTMINIYSTSGTRLSQQVVSLSGFDNTSLAVNELAAGMYILEMVSSNGTVREAFMVK
jgi:hypothetical protein